MPDFKVLLIFIIQFIHQKALIIRGYLSLGLFYPDNDKADDPLLTEKTRNKKTSKCGCHILGYSQGFLYSLCISARASSGYILLPHQLRL